MKTFQIENQELREELEEVRRTLKERTMLYPSGKHTLGRTVEVIDDEGQVYRLEASAWAFFVPTKSRRSNQPRRDEMGRIVYDFSTMYVAVDDERIQLTCVFVAEAVLITVKPQQRKSVPFSYRSMTPNASGYTRVNN